MLHDEIAPRELNTNTEGGDRNGRVQTGTSAENSVHTGITNVRRAQFLNQTRPLVLTSVKKGRGLVAGRPFNIITWAKKRIDGAEPSVKKSKILKGQVDGETSSCTYPGRIVNGEIRSARFEDG